MATSALNFFRSVSRGILNKTSVDVVIVFIVHKGSQNKCLWTSCGLHVLINCLRVWSEIYGMDLGSLSMKDILSTNLTLLSMYSKISCCSLWRTVFVCG